MIKQIIMVLRSKQDESEEASFYICRFTVTFFTSVAEEKPVHSVISLHVQYIMTE